MTSLVRLFATLLALAGAVEFLAAEQPRPDLPVPVTSMGAVVSDGFLYVYGGHMGKPHFYSTETTSGQFHRLDLRDPKASWEELPGGPHVQGMNLAAHKGRIIRVGGMEPRNKRSEKMSIFSIDGAAIYDPKVRKWSPLPDMPAPRSSHDVVVIGDRVFVVGGWRLDGKGMTGVWHDNALVLDLAAAKPEWKSISQPFRRRALTAAAHDGKVYVLGGLTSEESQKKVDIYDPAANAWSTGPDFPGSERAGFSPAACSLGRALYLNTGDGTLLRFNDKGTGWDKAGAIATPRIVHRLVPWQDSVLAVGGSGKKGIVPGIESIAVPK